MVHSPRSEVLLRILRFFLYAALFGAGVAGGLMLLLRFSLLRPGTLVPSVRGLTADQAAWEAQRAGLSFLVKDERYDARLEKGRVVDQSPPPGTSVRKGMTLSVVVSRGVDLVEAPTLVGLRLETAQLQAQQAGLRTGSVSYLPEAAAPSTVLAQFPPPGARVPRDSGADLLVSLGGESPLFIAPDLRGLAPGQAATLLNEYGILASVGTTPGQGSSEGRVVGQEPRPGYPLSRRDTVQLVVERP